MGSFMPYKNVELLVRAMQQLPGFTLTLCSKIESRRRSQLLTGVDQSTISRINFVDGVSESEYQKILDECFALVSASRDEGFGIPVIEAMSRSIPVVLSDIPIFREVSGGAGLFFDPNSVTEFLEAIRDLESIEKWQQSSQLSLNRSMDFSWNQSADKLLALVEDLRG
jgi:glycosyltransferase involved in cell wall biosynthesis